MAYNSHNLSVLAYANGFTLWHYRIEDPLEEVTAHKYFEPAADMLRAGDMLLINFGGPRYYRNVDMFSKVRIIDDGLYVFDGGSVARCV